MKATLPRITKGPWRLNYQTAKEARDEADNGTDAGGANGFINAPDPNNRFGQTILFFPYNRNLKRDAECKANAIAFAAVPDLLAVALAAINGDPNLVELAKAALVKAGGTVKS
jgi:hypothetical protein